MTVKIEFEEAILQKAKIAKALSHPARIYILKKLSGIDACSIAAIWLMNFPLAVLRFRNT